ncbi:Holliday junction branch migration protein RuvA [Patescibacteria group bacterium]|nr:Holliday junction branch migration protein RuvA [Patescibacteria group bacterium]
MIISLEGKITFRAERFLILEANHIGYKVFVGPETLRKIPQNQETVKIFTSAYQREDAAELYGFLTLAELHLFEALNGVSGVGPRTSLAVLGVAPLDMLKRAIGAGETSYLTKVSGIGRKVAEKIILELREKMGAVTEKGEGLQQEEDALDALRSLGYSPREAREALARTPVEVEGVEKRIKAALMILGKTK